jgi:hypothetical protein
MATWIIEAFFSPLIHLHQSRIETFLEDLTVKYVCWHFERMDQSGVFSYHGFHASGQDTQVDQNISICRPLHGSSLLGCASV